VNRRRSIIAGGRRGAVPPVDPPPPPPPSAGGRPLFGLYTHGWAEPWMIEQFEDWSGIRVDMISATLPRDNPPNLDGSSGWFRSTVLGPLKRCRQKWPNRAIEPTVAGIAAPGGMNWPLMLRAANGEFVGHWRRMIILIRDEIGGEVHLRFIHEHCGTWMNHSWDQYSAGAKDRAPIASTIFRLWMDQVGELWPAALPHVCWNITMDGAERAADLVHLSYPGGGRRPVVGVNVYPQEWGADAVSTQARRAREMRAMQKGLAFAKSRGVKFALPEFNVGKGKGSGAAAWGGDEPSFMEQIAAFVRANAADISYVCLFDVDTPNVDHRIRVTNPQAGAAFRRVFQPLFGTWTPARDVAPMPVPEAQPAPPPPDLYPDRSRPPELWDVGDLSGAPA
jgi:hypothetical protein